MKAVIKARERSREKDDLSVGKIIQNNVLTYFNLIYVVLTLLLIYAKSYRSLTFLPVVIFNTVLGIIQQLRSKRILDKLNVLGKQKYEVIRDGASVSLSADLLKANDVILLSEGHQIPADACITEGKISVNESLITGESDEIEKCEGDELLSGSFIAAGKCKAKLIRVGEDSYAARLEKEARRLKAHKSGMVKNIDQIIKVSAIAIVPIGLLLFLEARFLNHSTTGNSIVSMVAAVIGMIPQGLYLLLTVALSIGAMRLAMKKVLLHDMRSIETLARVDVLCVDKTGTITSNEMEVFELFHPVSGVDSADAETLLGQYVRTNTDSNITMLALKDYFGDGPSFAHAHVTPFSSKNKYSRILTDGTEYRLGAPEFLLSEADLDRNRDILKEKQDTGLRVLVFTENGSPILFVSLKNGIRKNAPEIFRFFREQEVTVKVISGDNPLTVSQIAKQVGIPGAERCVDASTLTDDMLREAATKYTVFGRVRPEQKKALILAMKDQGLKVAMTGDGVNDILAMKEADCSIAMGTGSDAARQAAQVVLLDSDFSRMEDIVGQGRQIINNLTRSATLFLYKNLLSAALSVFAILTFTTYPFVPSQVTLVASFLIGLPGFLLSLEKNTKKQSHDFLKEVFRQVVPAAFTAFVSIAVISFLSGVVINISETELGTVCTYVMAITGLMLLIKVTWPLSKYRAIVLACCAGGFMLFVTAPFLRQLFLIAEITRKGYKVFFITAAVDLVLICLGRLIYNKVTGHKKPQHKV